MGKFTGQVHRERFNRRCTVNVSSQWMLDMCRWIATMSRVGAVLERWSLGQIYQGKRKRNIRTCTVNVSLQQMCARAV